MSTAPTTEQPVHQQPSAEGEEDIYALGAKITLLQSTIRQMKKDGAPANEIASEVEKLTTLRAKVATLAKGEEEEPFNRRTFDELILRKMYVVQSFEIHNGPAGLFDYGPPASALKANMLALWRRHFVLEENMLEMECTNLTPSSVLETSGHVERFTDFMVKDEVTGDCFRADKLLEDLIDAFLVANPLLPEAEKEAHRIIQRQADAFSAEELHNMLNKYDAKSPTNPAHGLTKPFPFNLMFKTTIGPEGTAVGYLRPETAQGLFVNFRRLLDYNQQRMPFAAAQIGLGFRNEIAPRNGLLRVREFCMAEIEHFVNPADKAHPKFKRVADQLLTLFPADAQLGSGRTVRMSIGDAVTQGIVNNETLGYFMARTAQWAKLIGVKEEKMRFRQHLKTEMAHYAADCWDLEIKMSYGWIECVGHADRACYDLEQHSKRTGVALIASERLPAPVQVERVAIEPNKKLLGPRFKTEQKLVLAALEALSEEEVALLQSNIEKDGKGFVGKYELTADLLTFVKEKKTIHEAKYTPSVIEPSYGIGRILYAVLEHAFSQREQDEQRCVMSFKPIVAPIKVAVFKLLNHPPFEPVVQKVQHFLQKENLSTRVDSSSGSLGRRYARSDELGVPFAVTVDFQTLLDQTVTLRERDSMQQVRLSIDVLVGTVQALVNESLSWADVTKKFMIVNNGENDEDDEEGAAKTASSAEKTVKKASSPTVVSYSSRGSFSRPNIV